MGHITDQELIARSRSSARACIEHPQVAFVGLAAVLAWGVFGYLKMPQRKDPDIQVRQCMIVTPWPGVEAARVEQLVTRKIERVVGLNARIDEIKSISRNGLSVVFGEVQEKGHFDVLKEFDDLKGKLDGIKDLPDGSGPIYFVKDFGDTAALMLTVASPRVSAEEITSRAATIRKAIEDVRAGKTGDRTTIVLAHPSGMDPELLKRPAELLRLSWVDRKVGKGLQIIQAAGFIGLDLESDRSEGDLRQELRRFAEENLRSDQVHPDLWEPIIVRSPGDTAKLLAAVAGDRYSYREMDNFTDVIERQLKLIPLVSKVERSGVLDERVYLTFSQNRLAAYGLSPVAFMKALRARNITAAGGEVNAGGRNIAIIPAGEFRSVNEIGSVAVGTAPGGAPIYIRDVAEIQREYESPAQYLNHYTRRTESGGWLTTRAITLSVQMRKGEQISEFGKLVDSRLAEVKPLLPADLVLARTSDQPRQVTENVDLFMSSLWEAIILVVVVSWLGFWSWRSAILMALAIPITLAITFGMMYVLGVDLQQVSIASLIIALGLLVDVPVVSGDAIERAMGHGHKRSIAAWLGPTKLFTTMLYATLTNVVAYLPFLMLTGDTGKFMYSLPIVITCSLVAAQIVAMTFVPLISRYLLKPKPEVPIEQQRVTGYGKWYWKIGSWAIAHRKLCALSSLAILFVGVHFLKQLPQQFFPKDLQYLSYVDVWLPEDAPLEATERASKRAEAVIRQVSEEYGKEHKKTEPVLKSMTTFVGGGGPRFWLSATPEARQVNYAQIVVEVQDKHDTNHLVGPWQVALMAGVPEARVDVRQLETGKPIGIPVQIRLMGDHIPTLRAEAERLKALFRKVPFALRIRDDWGVDSFQTVFTLDQDRAAVAGVTAEELEASTAVAVDGFAVTTYREGDKQLPVFARLRMNERNVLSRLDDLYVYSQQDARRVPLKQIATVEHRFEPARLRRFNQFRTMTVSCFPAPGRLPSEVLVAAQDDLEEFKKTLAPGVRLEIAGEHKEQVNGFEELTVVLLISVLLIYIALVVQFKSAIKPVLVFAAIPYGMTGALVSLYLMNAPFGFMAFLGVVSLVGVIVSHIIVLFDFIEERREHGAPLEEALLDAGIQRLRPVMITVAATVLALFPLASHGGPLWEPLCYAQIGGLSIATFITLGLVPVLYAITVRDLKWITWAKPSHEPEEPQVSASAKLVTEV
ncbi:MAG: efflux RND transporter permease subunit [Bryobacteraceae bacterium]|nr:efflux RND transporter permease subunit [Bryobacteraceae bacterium]